MSKVLETPEPTSAPTRRPRALSEEAVARVLRRMPALPEPLAAIALEIDLARDAGDATGVRKRLFELGIGVVRYAVSFGLAALAARMKGGAAPRPIADALRKAAKLPDGRWCELVRLLRASLPKGDPAARALAFVASAAMNDLVASRNSFVHGGSAGDDAPERADAVLEAANDLLTMPLHVVASTAPLMIETRAGVPKRAGVWRRTPGVTSSPIEVGHAYVADDAGARLDVTPWLPFAEQALRLVDSPVALGKAWRCIDPETGEHPEHAAFDAALRAFVGDDGTAVRVPVDRPALVGRGVPTSLIERAAREATDGKVRVLLFTATQGAGGSRLLREAVDAAAGLGLGATLTVFGSLDRRGPFGALRFALASSTEPTLAPARTAVERALDGEANGVRAQADAALEAVEEALVSASRARGLLFAIDDAQWLDEQTLAMVRLLTERATRGVHGRMALLLAARVEATPARGVARLIAQIDRDVGAGATRVDLSPLSHAEASRLVQNVAPVAPALERHLVHGARGLPFYLVQPILVWAETGALVWQRGAWTPRPPPQDPNERREWRDVLASAPPGIAELVEERIDSLFDADSRAAVVGHQTLACAALEGGATTRARLDAVMTKLGHDGALTARVVSSLVAARLVEDDGSLRVAQPMVARAMAEARRESAWWGPLVRALVEVLEDAPATESNAAHLARAWDLLGDHARARKWMRRAVEERIAQGAFDDARELAGELAERETDADARARAELYAVDALVRAGDAPAAAARLERIKFAQGSPWELVGRLAGARVACDLGRAEPAELAELVRAADARGDASAAVEARLLVARRVRGAAGRAAIDEALATVGALAAGHARDAKYRLLALDLELAYETRGGHTSELRDAAAKACAAARDVGSRWAELDVMNDAAILEADGGDIARALTMLEEVAIRAGEAHFGSLRRKALVNAATLELRRERGDEARARASLAEREGRAAGDWNVLAVALSVRGDAELRLGDLASARRALDESIAIKERAGDPTLALALLRRADAVLAVDGDAARADAEAALARAEGADNVNHAALARLWLAMDDVRRGGDDARARLARLVATLEPEMAQLRAAARRKLEEARRLLDER